MCCQKDDQNLNFTLTLVVHLKYELQQFKYNIDVTKLSMKNF